MHFILMLLLLIGCTQTDHKSSLERYSSQTETTAVNPTPTPIPTPHPEFTTGKCIKHKDKDPWEEGAIWKILTVGSHSYLTAMYVWKTKTWISENDDGMPIFDKFGTFETNYEVYPCP